MFVEGFAVMPIIGDVLACFVILNRRKNLWIGEIVDVFVQYWHVKVGIHV